LNAIIDAYLTHFGKDYTAWIDADFEFRASKPTNPDFRAGLLSGGEQMALAMAYRLAIAEVKGSNLPLIVLDEPTEGLDNEALRGLIEVLKIARTYAEKGLYIIIPTHSPEMEAAKSQVIDMEELAQC
jgi:exonuclease SbcC